MGPFINYGIIYYRSSLSLKELKEVFCVRILIVNFAASEQNCIGSNTLDENTRKTFRNKK